MLYIILILETSGFQKYDWLNPKGIFWARPKLPISLAVNIQKIFRQNRKVAVIEGDS